MFKKSRIKIIVAVMASIIVLLFVTLAVILVTSYAQVDNDNQRLLEQYSREYRLDGELTPQNKSSQDDLYTEEDAGTDESNEGTGVAGNSAEKIGTAGNNGESGEASTGELIQGDERPPEMDGQSPEEIHKFDVSTFYSVAIANDGTVLKVENGAGTLYSDETISEYADEIINSGSNKGKIKNLSYLKTQKNGYTLVVFIDNSIMQGGMTTVFKNTLIIGGIAVVVVFVISIFLAKRIVAPLEESFRKQKQFISDAGHELKTPVSVVNANAELLSREIGENQWLSNIQYENERMGSLVKQLLDLAKTENVAPQTEQLDFSRTVSGELLPFESVAFENGVKLVSDIAENVVVEGDSGRLKQLVSILIDNAIRHSEQKKEVKVTLKSERGFAKLSVVNEGDEIPADQQKLIFERFYRADQARGDDGNFGLGLAIAKAITESHKGKIGVSCYSGKIEFTALIPAAK